MSYIKRVPVSPNINRNDYNNNNLHEYDPYILTEDQQGVIIDQVWYSSLTPYVRALLEERLKDRYTLGTVEVPHLAGKDSVDKLLTTIYQSYIDGFDYNIWYHPELPCGPCDVKMFPISDEVKKCLLYNLDLDGELTDFTNKIQEYMDTTTTKDTTKYFVRLSSTSGKNERTVPPLGNAKDIVKHMIGNSLFNNQEYIRSKPSWLVLIPWNEKIDPRYEFRIFVVNNRLVAASPQKWWELIQHTGEELELFEEVFAKIEFINHINNPYHTFIADVYVDVENRVVKLIELNPFGAHCGAGSSLFNWIKDYDLLHGSSLTGEAELRYLSAINY